MTATIKCRELPEWDARAKAGEITIYGLEVLRENKGYRISYDVVIPLTTQPLQARMFKSWLRQPSANGYTEQMKTTKLQASRFGVPSGVPCLKFGLHHQGGWLVLLIPWAFNPPITPKSLIPSLIEWRISLTASSSWRCLFAAKPLATTRNATKWAIPTLSKAQECVGNPSARPRLG